MADPLPETSLSFHRQPSRRRAYVALGIGVIGIGWSAIFVRWTGIPGSSSAFYRMALAQLVFLPWSLASGTRIGMLKPRAIGAAVLAGVFFAADLAFFNTAVMTTTVGNATLLGVNAPVFVALGAWLFYGERPTAAFWSGFVLSVTGVAAIVGVDVLRHPKLGTGDLLAIAGAVCYAGYLLYVQRSRIGMDALTFSALSGVVAALTLLAICLAIGAPLRGFGRGTWSALIGLALITQVVGHLGVAYSLGRLPVSATSVVLLAQAPLTAILAVPLLHEGITALQLMGGALVLVGIYVVNRRGRG